MISKSLPPVGFNWTYGFDPENETCSFFPIGLINPSGQLSLWISGYFWPKTGQKAVLFLTRSVAKFEYHKCNYIWENIFIIPPSSLWCRIKLKFSLLFCIKVAFSLDCCVTTSCLVADLRSLTKATNCETSSVSLTSARTIRQVIEAIIDWKVLSSLTFRKWPRLLNFKVLLPMSNRNRNIPVFLDYLCAIEYLPWNDGDIRMKSQVVLNAISIRFDMLASIEYVLFG